MEKEKNEGGGIYSALFEFHKAVPILKKDSEAGTKFKYKYGSLPMILEAIKPHLEASGLLIMQPIEQDDSKGQIIRTIVHHVESGTSLESEMKIMEVDFQQMNQLQSVGAVISYLRRYALVSILCLSLEEDDNDGQGVQKKATGSTSAPQTVKPSNGQDKGPELPWLNPQVYGKVDPRWADAVKYLAQGGTLPEILKKYRLSKANQEGIQAEAMQWDQQVEPEQNQQQETPPPPEIPF